VVGDKLAIGHYDVRHELVLEYRDAARNGFQFRFENQQQGTTEAPIVLRFFRVLRDLKADLPVLFCEAHDNAIITDSVDDTRLKLPLPQQAE